MRDKRPDFFIVSAPRCGTTAMYEYLGDHPDIFFPDTKEILYFGSDLHPRYTVTLKQYLALYDEVANEKRVGDASVLYLHSKTAAIEIKQFSPEAKIIIMLRDPVEAMFSLHSMHLYRGSEYINDFAEALQAESDRKQGRRLPKSVSAAEQLYYRDVYKYTEQVRRYLDVFGQDHVHIIIYDDFAKDMAGVYRGTLTFLGVDDDCRTDFRVINGQRRLISRGFANMLNKYELVMRSVARTLHIPHRRFLFETLWKLNSQSEHQKPMDMELRDQLRFEFSPEVERLGRLLGRDLSSWSQ